MLAAGPDRGDPDRPAVRSGDDLHVAAVVLVFSGPPEVCPVGSGGGDAVGADDGAVQVEVGVAGRGGSLQRGGEVRCVIGEHGQSLVRVAVGRGQRYGVVAGELGHARAVDEPPQDQDRLPEGAQGAGGPAGPDALAVLMQEPGQVLSGRPADIEDSGVGDTGGHVEPLVAVRNVIFAESFLPGASRMSDVGPPLRLPTPSYAPQPSRCREGLTVPAPPR